MTVNELYILALKRGLENSNLLVEYECDDDYYCSTHSVEEDNLRTDADGNAIIHIDNNFDRG